MTCIVGIADGKRVVIGGDSAGVSGLDIVIRRDPKVFRVGPYVIGYTSSFRMGQLLRFKLNCPEQDPRHDDFQHMATVFVDNVRTVLKDNGYAVITNNEESGGVFLVGYRGRLYKVESDFQVGESSDDYDAVGCGESFALGSLFATPKLPPKKRIDLALTAATHHSAGVRAPFVVVGSDD